MCLYFFLLLCDQMRGGDFKEAEEVQGDFTVHEVAHGEYIEDSNHCMKSSTYV